MRHRINGGISGPLRANLLLSLVRLMVLSSLVFAISSIAQAHELRPSVGDLSVSEGQAQLQIELNLEALLAGIDLSAHDDSTESPEAAKYDLLREEPPAVLSDALRAAWPDLASRITFDAGETATQLELGDISVPEIGDPELPRESRITITTELPTDGSPLIIGWDASLGPLVLRQIGVEDGYTAYLNNGALSEPIPRDAAVDQSMFEVFVDYAIIGFEHIIPKGLDHILFVLGLFFLSNKLAPLLWQVTAFTVAHTITLALGILDIIRVPAEIVEPIIAASIVYVGVENVLSKGLTPWRPVVVFAFGLLHGLGFASVLGDIGLSPGAFVTSLVGFNIGVELGQLAVIAIAFLTVGVWFGRKPWYKQYIANPASIAIAFVGAWWVVERTLL